MIIKAKKALSLLMALIMIISPMTTIQVVAQNQDTYEPGFSYVDHYQAMLDVFGATFRFDDFLLDMRDAPRPDAEYIIPAADYILVDGMDALHYIDFEGMDGTAVMTGEEGAITWSFYVAQAGLYHVSVGYFNVQGRNTEIQRAVFINGELPFFQASSVQFYRTWVNQLDYIIQDGAGNDLRPTQMEYRLWREAGLRDAAGQHNEYLMFYFNEGYNTITLLSQREPMLISHIRIHQRHDAPPYSEVSAGFEGIPRPIIDPIRIGGEESVRRSSPVLAPRANMGGPGVYPIDPRRSVINYSGGYPWSAPGMWIEWEFEVPESGLYNIAMNIQQNFHRGAMAHRRISINGQVPFAELEAVPFGFNSRWRVETLGAENPFMVYLEAGTNVIRMEATIGGYAPYLRSIQSAVHNLTRIHRQVVMVTGVNPDLARDYQIGRRVPTLREDIITERDRLISAFEGLVALSGGNLSERDVVVRNAFMSLDNMLSDLDEIPRRLGDFNIFIGGLGTWLMQVREQSLSVDAIYILPVGAPGPTNGDRFFARLWHGIVSLVLSFFIDFHSIGDADEYGVTRTIEVWIGTDGSRWAVNVGAGPGQQAGRDQAVILRSMIDETFTRYTGIGVNLMLVDMAMLLPATVARQGPDVALGVWMDLPMNFAFRGAVADISDFEGFEEVTERFHEAAMVPFMYQGMAFALPETFSFNMMFYRRDVLQTLGLEPPDTWDDVRASIAVLDHNNLNFGMLSGSMDDIKRSFGMFLMQSGEAFYTPDGRFSTLSTDTALTAFRNFTRFWTDYELPREFNFQNQFRTGEMPIGIADYTVFNLLQVLAPEINGLWGFRPVPGVKMPDGSINRAAPSGGSGVIMMEQANDKDAAWEFMKWWTDAQTQTQFGVMMESVMGPAARHATANMEALGRLPWTIREYNNIMYQFGHVQGVPQVPGGYLTPRYIRDAWANVVIEENMEARDAMRIATRRIDDEIASKRREFGLD